MKKSILSLLVAMACSPLLVNISLASPLPLRDPKYSFDQTKLDAAADSFHFLRSYVDYFYLLLNFNQSALPAVTSLQTTTGWCVGDAHPENFGVLIQEDGRPMFTMNDMDDSGPCPVALDLVRLMVSSRLYSSGTKIETLLDAYLEGLARQSIAIPAAVSDMLKRGQKQGFIPSSKKVTGEKIIRDADMAEVSPEDFLQIKSALMALKPFQLKQTDILDLIATRKIGGGSGGLLRYEILLKSGGQLLHLEMKELTIPAIYPVAAGQIPPADERIATAIGHNQSASPSPLYAVVQINGRDMMIRPRFAGNIGVSLSKKRHADNQDIILYEAYTLGLIHSRSVENTASWIRQLQSVNRSAVECDIALITGHINSKYNSLK
jgi:hypothetical protein